MNEMIVKLKWDKKLGKFWMNLDNLKILLFSSEKTSKELLQVSEVKEDE